MIQPETSPAKRKYSLDWFVRGILTRLGDMFDRFTGRNWQPSNNLATSQIIEKLKTLLDAEAKDFGERGKFVPHHIQLKMQWDKFSTDAAEQSLKKLEYELLTAAIDYINDCRYYTYAPMQFEIKPDYFTEGVELSANFDDFADEKEYKAAPQVAAPNLKNVVIPLSETEVAEPEKKVFVASFTVNNQPEKVKLVFSEGTRKSVGRTKESDLRLDDASVSKLHAALVLNGENQLVLADTGSTNGTFINGVRIAYGKANVLEDTDKLSFGTIEVELRRVETENDADEIFNEDTVAKNTFANAKSSSEKNVPINEIYAARENFQIKEGAEGKQNLSAKTSPTPPAQNFIIKNDFPIDKSLSATEKKFVADSNDKKPDEIKKEEL